MILSKIGIAVAACFATLGLALPLHTFIYLLCFVCFAVFCGFLISLFSIYSS
jgi:hypothetical protein